jgi:hypothetical protein
MEGLVRRLTNRGIRASHMKQREPVPGVTAYAERVLTWGREELNRADTKA